MVICRHSYSVYFHITNVHSYSCLVNQPICKAVIPQYWYFFEIYLPHLRYLWFIYLYFLSCLFYYLKVVHLFVGVIWKSLSPLEIFMIYIPVGQRILLPPKLWANTRRGAAEDGLKSNILSYEINNIPLGLRRQSNTFEML